MAKLLEQEQNICLYELLDGDVRLLLTNFGASIFSVEMKDGEGQYLPLTLGCDSLREFCENKAFFGATVGRTVNRIKNGRFTLNGQQYQLTVNDGCNSAHGGDASFATRVWSSRIEEDGSVTFGILSKDGEAGYPGTLSAEVNYRLKDNAIRITHQASSEADTIVNFTNHTYWSIGGPDTKVYDQLLTIRATEYLETANDLIPTGQVLSVKGTPFDFTEPHAIGERINDAHPSLQQNRGYDVSFVRAEREPGFACRLQDPKSGRSIEVYTSYPDMHIYTGNFLDGDPGRDGRRYQKHDAVCLECSRFPDAINHPCFSRIVLRKGETYEEFTEYRLK